MSLVDYVLLLHGQHNTRFSVHCVTLEWYKAVFLTLIILSLLIQRPHQLPHQLPSISTQGNSANLRTFEESLGLRHHQPWGILKRQRTPTTAQKRTRVIAITEAASAPSTKYTATVPCATERDATRNVSAGRHVMFVDVPGEVKALFNGHIHKGIIVGKVCRWVFEFGCLPWCLR